MKISALTAIAAAVVVLAAGSASAQAVCNPHCTVDCPPNGGPCRIIPTPQPKPAPGGGGCGWGCIRPF